tara:strand:+ start:4070 stop:4492 length:423 start_codon:yes stop_codon:yes gene_type:complete
MAFFTENDMIEYFPDLHEYGIQDFSNMIAKTDEDIIRLLRIEWWPTIPGRNRQDRMDSTKLKDSQLTRSAVYYCLQKYVLPKLTMWAVEGDSFQTQIVFYKNAFDEEFDQAKRSLFYDFDNDGSFEDSEQVIQPAQRLVR